MRDLRKEHLSLLYSIRDNSFKAILANFGLKRTQVKALFHYYPTFYHLHVHFAHVKMSERMGASLGKGVLLDDVIEHLEMDGEYFMKKTMSV